jgi:glycosyltransferase involved in cell wall biosynthesis
MRPRISVITVVYNGQETILDTLRSVAAQTYDNVEHIVIDGASSDDTLSIINANRSRIATLISEKDAGIYDAMNKGLRHATGEIVGFLNADDMFHDSNVLSDLAKIFEGEGPDLVYGDVVYIRPTDKSRIIRHFSSRNFTPRRLAYGMAPAHPTLYVKRTLYDKLGPMKTDYAIAADFDFIARIFQSQPVKARYLDRVFVTMRTGGVSTKGLRSMWINNREILRACRENGIPTNYAMIYLKYFAKLLELRPLQLYR